MTQLTLTDIAEPAPITAPITAPEPDPASFADNGKLWESILNTYQTSKKSLDNLGALIGEAVKKKIWLGMINPRNGKLCKFTYTGRDGEIDDSLSFKMWLSSSPSRGGLGIDDLSIIESSIKNDRELREQIIPLLVDRKSIKLANKIRQENGEPPLLTINKTKESCLRRLGMYPPVFTHFWESKRVQRDFILTAVSAYDKLPEDQKSGAVEQLEKLFTSTDDDTNQTEISLKISKIVGSDYFRLVRLSLTDYHQSAQKIVEFYKDDADALRKLADEILGLID